MPEEIRQIANTRPLYLPDRYQEPHVALVGDELIELRPVWRRSVYTRLVASPSNGPGPTAGGC